MREPGLRSSLGCALRKRKPPSSSLALAAIGSVSGDRAFPRLGGITVTLAALVSTRARLVSTACAVFGCSGSVTLRRLRPPRCGFTVYVPGRARERPRTAHARVGGCRLRPGAGSTCSTSRCRGRCISTRSSTSPSRRSRDGRRGGEDHFEAPVTPASVTWPSGFRYDITQQPASTTRCTAFWGRASTEGAAYSIGSRRSTSPAGNGVWLPARWRSPSSTTTPAPPPLRRRSGPRRLRRLQRRVVALPRRAPRLPRAARHALTAPTTYAQNEPQNADDYRLAAHLCCLTCVSRRGSARDQREPKPEIAEDAGALRLEHLDRRPPALPPDYAWRRQRERGGSVWFYSLDQDPDPSSTRPASIGRAAFPHHSRGSRGTTARRAGPATTRGAFDGVRPTVRAGALREGLKTTSTSASPTAAPPRGRRGRRPAVDSVASSLTGWTQDPAPSPPLRHELGAGHERTTLRWWSPRRSPAAPARGLRHQLPGPARPDGRPARGRRAHQSSGTPSTRARLRVVGRETSATPRWRYGYDERDGYDERQRGASSTTTTAARPLQVARRTGATA